LRRRDRTLLELHRVVFPAAREPLRHAWTYLLGASGDSSGAGLVTRAQEPNAPARGNEQKFSRRAGARAGVARRRARNLDGICLASPAWSCPPVSEDCRCRCDTPRPVHAARHWLGIQSLPPFCQVSHRVTVSPDGHRFLESIPARGAEPVSIAVDLTRPLFAHRLASPLFRPGYGPSPPSSEAPCSPRFALLE
jgi:hypothetical protein